MTNRLPHSDIRKACGAGPSDKEMKCTLCHHRHLQLFGDDDCKCQNGCKTEEVIAKCRRRLSTGAIPQPEAASAKPKDYPVGDFHIAEYGIAKNLAPLPFKQWFEATEGPHPYYKGVTCGVCFPYWNEDGKEITQQWRWGMERGRRAYLAKRPTYLYGGHALQHLEQLAAAGQGVETIYLCEGESNVHTLVQAGYPALGLPGVGNWQKEWAKLKCLQATRRIYFFMDMQENGDPEDVAQRGAEKVAKDFEPGKVLAVKLPIKDVSALWLFHTKEPMGEGVEGFHRALRGCIADAEPVIPRAATKSVASREPEYVSETLSNIPAKALEWFWQNRIPRKKVTVFGGDPGVGKTLSICDIVARATTGKAFPGETATREPVDVLMLFCEDDADDTVIPRLMAAGANLERVHRLRAIAVSQLTEKSTKEERDIAFDSDLKVLKKFLADHPEVKLVTVDPVTSYLGNVKPNDEKEVRKVLIPLAAVARDFDVTFILNAHFNKRGDVSALHKILGAVAMTGVARAVWLFAEDKESPDPENPKYLMLQGKLNVGRRQKGLEYTIGERQIPLPDGGTTSVGFIQWGEATDKTADAALGSIGAFGDESGTKLKAAGVWLAQFLAGGDQLVDDIKKARPKSIGWRTMETAKKILGIVSKPQNGHWWWHLPERSESEKSSAGFDNLEPSM